MLYFVFSPHSVDKTPRELCQQAEAGIIWWCVITKPQISTKMKIKIKVRFLRVYCFFCLFEFVVLLPSAKQSTSSQHSFTSFLKSLRKAKT
jgi:hypothetical protein